MDDHFEGVGKKNTRKKKNKGQQNQAADLMAAAFDEGADSDEVHARKGGKKEKRDKREHQGKKKNKNKQQSDDEAREEEKVEENKEEANESEKADNGPLEVVYCKCKYKLVVINYIL